MCQPETHWVLKQKIILFHSFQIKINKKNIDVSYAATF